ncbi:MAG TPA: polysaccharide deacetylase family protein [Ilumatobacteraceae bacterium]|nr:polysaccharide deacetylase family protein [Ilumatobacteraceae bacterium]
MTSPVVTLTFDNGPTPGITQEVFDVLAGCEVPATFFTIGHKLSTPEGTELGRETVSRGHRLGGHTWSHSVQFGVAAEDVILDELARTRAAVDDAGGEGSLFRPYGAGGVIDDLLMSSFGASSLCAGGYTCVLWNVLPGDWRDADGWVDAALDEIERHPWSVVVLHDVVDASLPRLGEFLDRVNALDPRWSQDFPEDCTPIRNGLPTSSFDSLNAST